MNVVLVGATKGMGRALARRFAERGDRLAILGRNVSELERSKSDLEVRGADRVVLGKCDLEETSSFAEAIALADEALGGIDTIVLTASMFAPQDRLESEPEFAERLLQVNFTNTIVFCETAKRHLLSAGGGTLCVFSSVAGERGRKPVVIYGASKAGISRYLEGLDHKHRSEGLRVVTVKPGFVKTSMTDGLAPPPFAGEPDEVAGIVINAIDRGTPVVYAPAPWRYVMAVIRHLPRAVMRRVSF